MNNSKREKVTLDEATEHMICQKALIMYKILEGYSRYCDMLSNRTFALNKLTYQEAEKLSELLHDFMGIEYTTDELLWDEDECTNAAIEDYNKLQELLNTTFDEELRTAVMAFYKHIHHNFVSVYFQSGGPHLYPRILLQFLDYACGGCTKQELKNSFVEIRLPGPTTQVIDSMYFRKDMNTLEEIFNEILMKRQARRMNKENHPAVDEESSVEREYPIHLS